MSDQAVRIGLLGCGIVGSGVLRMLDANADDIAQRIGARIEVAAVVVRSPSKKRDIPASMEPLLGTDARAVVEDPSIDVIVEVMGGIEPARSLILDSLRSGKRIVTANKELLASLGKDLFDAADAAGMDLRFEGAVAGGIPLIRPLKEGLAGDKIHKIMGIVNGTTNFILTRMSEDGLEFGEALAEAERLGYTELDPSADIEGFDPAAKCAILASIAFNSRVVSGDVYREGISNVTATDIAFAKRLGYEVKLLAIAEEHDGAISARVHPAMVPVAHPLASVRENLNAVFVEGERVGELMFYGRGAGGNPTATSVVGDIADVARNVVRGAKGIGCTCYLSKPVRSMDESFGQYYMLLEVADLPGVLAAVADVFAKHNVSIRSVWQEGHGEGAQLVLITHRAREGDLQQTVEALRGLPAVTEVQSVMRVEGGEA